MSHVALWGAVAALGGAGACLRFAAGAVVSRRTSRRFPWGTFTVNVTGCLALGVLAGRHVTGDALLLAGTALLGAYTTFSTLMLETHRLAEGGRLRTALVYLGGSLAAGIGAFLAGRGAGGW